MRILWLCNVAIPKIAKAAGIKATPFGGWLVSTADAIMNDQQNELIVCFPQFSSQQTLNGQIGNLRYYGYYEAPHSAYEYSAAVENEFARILRLEKPELIHAWGTEYPRTLAMMKAAKSASIPQTVISIQGLCTPYAEHYMNGVPQSVRNAYTVRDLLRRDNLSRQYRKFLRQAKYERQALEMTGYVIGRTEWDKACASQLAPQAEYHYCAETLRAPFYEGQWSYAACEKHSIFVSQCAYPIKGFHYVLKAMPLILQRYPDIKLYTTGQDVRKLPFYRITAYQRYLRKLICQYDLDDKVVFTGQLDEAGMRERYLKSNVFVSASSIENSPNSVGEAMLLGVPIVASYVGGTMDMLKDKAEGYLYQSDAGYMLAYYVCKVFEDEANAAAMGQAARKHALNTHDRERNRQALMGIYSELTQGK